MPDHPSDNGKIKRRLFVPVLLICVFITWSFTAFFSTLLLDIASTFRVSVGTATQVLTVARIIGFAFSLVMSFLTIRLSHKSLFIAGILLFGLGVLGSYLASNFASLVFCQILVGSGFTTVAIISLTLIGDVLPFEKRGPAIGFVVSAGLLAYVFVPPLSSAISTVAGWRSVLIWFIFPVTVVSLIFCLLIIPMKRQTSFARRFQYLEVFKRILSNKSAIACVSSLALLALLSSVSIFAVSFYRMVFLCSPIAAAMYSSIAAASGVVGGLFGGGLINIIGKKRLAVITASVSSVLTMTFVFIPNDIISVVLWAASACALSMNLASLHSLVLEQDPPHRGPMMSVENTFRNVGLILGVAIGGLILEMFANNFRLLMLIFGLSALISVPILILKAKEAHVD
jgi:MFS transporter, DHA1 family, inner membrane transport protein